MYLQVLEELAAGWLSVGIGVSVHTLALLPAGDVRHHGAARRWLPDMLGGSLLGAYCLSEPHVRIRRRGAAHARGPRRAIAYVVTGTKAWITHGGVADFYNLMVRTSDDRRRAASPACSPRRHARAVGRGARAQDGPAPSPTAQILLDGARVAAERRIGEEGQGFTIALAALDSGGSASPPAPSASPRPRSTRPSPTPRSGGSSAGRSPTSRACQFMLADMATQVAAARELYLAAARRRDAGQAFGHQAAMAKLFATDTAMRVTTDAVQVLGGDGYVEDFPLERYIREAKVLQIVEGTNQIQRVVIGGRRLAQVLSSGCHGLDTAQTTRLDMLRSWRTSTGRSSGCCRVTAGCRTPSWARPLDCRPRRSTSGSGGSRSAASSRGYGAVVDADAVGPAADRLRVDHTAGPVGTGRRPERLAGLPEIEACHSVAGEESYILKVRVATPGDLEDLLARIRATANVQTRTTIVLSTLYEGRPPAALTLRKPVRSVRRHARVVCARAPACGEEPGSGGGERLSSARRAADRVVLACSRPPLLARRPRAASRSGRSRCSAGRARRRRRARCRCGSSSSSS